MNAFARIGAAVAAAVIVVSAASAQTVDLTKKPAFSVGDKVIYKLTGSGERKLSGADQKVAQQEKRARLEETLQEVLEVDASGQVQAIRITLSSAARTISSSIPKEQAFERKVGVRQITAVARRKGLFFEVDTTSIASPDTQELTASQIALVKDLIGETVDFFGYRDADAMLLPQQGVRVGSKWDVPQATLDEWVRNSASTRKLGATATSAKFQLESMNGKIATVRGMIQLKAPMGPFTATPMLEMSASIHTGAGHWVTDSTYILIAEKIPTGGTADKPEFSELIMEARNTGVLTYKPGNGTASPTPAGLANLGWPRPGPDTNNLKLHASGVSLNVPAGYRAEKTDPEQILAQYNSPKGASIALTASELSFPMDLPEVLKDSLVQLKTAIPGYALAEQKKVILADNVPAVLLVAKAGEGKISMSTLIAIDDQRLISVTGSAPANEADTVAEIQKSLQTLRVFDPADRPAELPPQPATEPATPPIPPTPPAPPTVPPTLPTPPTPPPATQPMTPPPGLENLPPPPPPPPPALTQPAEPLKPTPPKPVAPPPEDNEKPMPPKDAPKVAPPGPAKPPVAEDDERPMPVPPKDGDKHPTPAPPSGESADKPVPPKPAPDPDEDKPTPPKVAPKPPPAGEDDERPTPIGR